MCLATQSRADQNQLQRVPVLKRICPSSALHLLLPLFVAVQGRALGRPGFPGGPTYSGKPCKVACMWTAAMEYVWLSEQASPKGEESQCSFPLPPTKSEYTVGISCHPRHPAFITSWKAVREKKRKRSEPHHSSSPNPIT